MPTTLRNLPATATASPVPARAAVAGSTSMPTLLARLTSSTAAEYPPSFEPTLIPTLRRVTPSLVSCEALAATVEWLRKRVVAVTGASPVGSVRYAGRSAAKTYGETNGLPAVG